MPAKDFDAARRERLRERVPLQFTLQDETYTCVAVVPVGDAFDLGDAPESGAPGHTRALAEFIDRILIEEDRPRFARALRRTDDPVDPMTLYEIVGWLGEEYAARPTSPSADLSVGPEGDGPTSSSELAAKDLGISAA